MVYIIMLQKLKRQRDELKKYQKRVNGVMERDRRLARQLLADGKKERARLLLRKKKHQETLLARTDAQLDNLERLAQDIEFAQIESRVLDGLKSGNEALRAANAMFSIEEIEQIMDDTEEAVEKQREIDQMLSGQLTAEDEDAAMQELEDMLAEEEGERANADLDVVALPDVPTDELEGITLPHSSNTLTLTFSYRQKGESKESGTIDEGRGGGIVASSNFISTYLLCIANIFVIHVR